MPVPPSAPGVFTQQSVANVGGGGPDSAVVNVQPASMANDEHVESPRVDDEEEENQQSDGNEQDVE